DVGAVEVEDDEAATLGGRHRWGRRRLRRQGRRRRLDTRSGRRRLGFTRPNRRRRSRRGGRRRGRRRWSSGRQRGPRGSWGRARRGRRAGGDEGGQRDERDNATAETTLSGLAHQASQVAHGGEGLGEAADDLAAVPERLVASLSPAAGNRVAAPRREMVEALLVAESGTAAAGLPAAPPGGLAWGVPADAGGSDRGAVRPPGPPVA